MKRRTTILNTKIMSIECETQLVRVRNTAMTPLSKQQRQLKKTITVPTRNCCEAAPSSPVPSPGCVVSSPFSSNTKHACRLCFLCAIHLRLTRRTTTTYTYKIKCVSIRTFLGARRRYALMLRGEALLLVVDLHVQLRAVLEVHRGEVLGLEHLDVEDASSFG